jgi:hypothetical protein
VSLGTGRDERLTLNACGQLFARDVRPVLEALAQSREAEDSNHGTLPRRHQGPFTYPTTRPPRAVQLQRNAQLTVFKFTRSLQVSTSAEFFSAVGDTCVRLALGGGMAQRRPRPVVRAGAC